MQQNKYFKKDQLLYFAILIVTVGIAYSKVLNAGFISWDDPEYTLLNKDIQGISFEHISTWFSKFYIGNYQPLTIFSYAIDFLLGKQEPFVYHFVNILLHTINTLLLYAFINKMWNNKHIAFFCALLFALHPLQTESVSWVAERKTVLCGLFYLLSLYCYAIYISKKKTKQLIAVYIFAVAALLSKPAALSLPLSLFAVDIWMQRSLKDKNVWLSKLTLILLAIAFGLLAINAQKDYGFRNLHPEFKLYETIIFAGYAYTGYIIQLLVPIKLSVLYPYPKEIGAIHFIYAVASLAVLVLGVIAYKKKWYILCGGILFYTINIALVLQFVQFGEVMMADRYMYIASIGILVPLVYLLYTKLPQTITAVILVASSVGLLSMTYIRNDIWLNEFNFWEAIVEKFPNSSIAQSSMGGVYLQQGNYPEALQHLDEAIAIDSANYKAWYNKGVVLLRTNDVVKALSAFNKSISLHSYPKALFSRAILYQQINEYARAYDDIEKVLQQEPENSRAYYIKANCLEQQNNLQSAMDNYNKAIEYSDNDPLFYLRRGIVAVKLGQQSQALSDMNIAIDKAPEIGAAWYWRGLVKYGMKQQPCGDLNEALKRGYTDAQDAISKFCK